MAEEVVLGGPAHRLERRWLKSRPSFAASPSRYCERTVGKAAAPEVARLLLEYGRRTALAGGNPYRAKAYLRAAESLAAQTEPLARLIDENRLREIPGVGDAIADIITKLHRTGTHPSLEKMRAEFPDGVLDMLSIRACVRRK